MKNFSVLLVFILTALSVVAQTDTNAVVVPAGTNAPATLRPSPKRRHERAMAARRNASAREMSLEDCIQEALQHNLDVQIQRYNPQISLYNLRAAYGGYDPTFNFSGQHSLQRHRRGLSKRPARRRLDLRREQFQFGPERRRRRGA